MTDVEQTPDSPVDGCCRDAGGVCPCNTGTPLGAKLDRFDQHAEAAALWVLGWLADRPEEIIAVARGRHVTGHYVWNDRNFAEWDHGRLKKEILEELADAVVYATRLLAETQ